MTFNPPPLHEIILLVLVLIGWMYVIFFGEVHSYPALWTLLSMSLLSLLQERRLKTWEKKS